jgi:hypothetical protein
MIAVTTVREAAIGEETVLACAKAARALVRWMTETCGTCSPGRRPNTTLPNLYTEQVTSALPSILGHGLHRAG